MAAKSISKGLYQIRGPCTVMGAKKTEGGDRAGMGAVNGLCTIIARVPSPQTSHRAEYFGQNISPYMYCPTCVRLAQK